MYIFPTNDATFLICINMKIAAYQCVQGYFDYVIQSNWVLCPLFCYLLFMLAFSLQHKPASCDVQAHKGDRVKVHYRVSNLFMLSSMKINLSNNLKNVFG